MLSGLKNWIFPDKKKTENSEEVIVPVFHSKNKTSDAQNVPGTTSDKDKRKCVTLDDDETWDKFFKIQKDVSTNITNTKKAKRFVHKNNNGMYEYTARDENKYNGKYIIGKVADKIEGEVLKSLGSDAVKSVALKESKDEDGIVMAAARIVLSGSTKPVNVSSLVSNPMCERYGLDSITFCLPDKNKTRGMRCRLGKDGTRIYEVANGSYEMDLK